MNAMLLAAAMLVLGGQNGQTVLGYVADASDAKQSFADSGHAVAFQRPAEMEGRSWR